ncbi:unnamed protein product [Nesidiocoris tenuis]|uniref:Uncharacterized protein n=1 Tax=Nesidiocoris tenuis TaxID=355587 RepID=A0A6H5FVJ1_9HEMI|nr:unnamed protein product [Nesidiocoris tenuis]
MYSIQIVSSFFLYVQNKKVRVFSYGGIRRTAQLAPANEACPKDTTIESSTAGGSSRWWACPADRASDWLSAARSGTKEPPRRLSEEQRSH